MRQHSTNMNQESYYIYCDAWCICFSKDTWDWYIEIDMANKAVNAGIVFG